MAYLRNVISSISLKDNNNSTVIYATTTTRLIDWLKQLFIGEEVKFKKVYVKLCAKVFLVSLFRESPHCVRTKNIRHWHNLAGMRVSDYNAS